MTTELNKIIGFYSVNPILNDCYRSFNTQLNLIPENSQIKAKENFDSFINRLEELNLSKLYVSVTTSNSLFFRFSNWNSNTEFKFEIFNEFTPTEEGDVESTLHIYESGKNKGSFFGNIHYLFSIVKEHSTAYPFVYAINKELEKDMEKIYSGVPQYSLSRHINPPFHFQPYYFPTILQKTVISQMG